MIAIRQAESDADLERWLEVRRAVVPNESAGTPEGLRARPDRLVVLAEVDGVVAGSGIAGRSDLAGRAFVTPRVLPEARRRGVGTALLRRLAAHAAMLGFDRASALVDDEGSAAFARRFGFVEVDRQVEQVRTLGDEPEPPALPEGVELVTLAERPELLEAAYPLACEGYADFATDAPASIARDDWLRDEGTLPAGSYVAPAGEEIVGYSGLCRHDREGVAEDGLTVVRRDWRGRGLATALKRHELAWAAGHGFREIVTWTQAGNVGMRAINERLGYVYRGECLTMLAALPLPR